MSRLDKFTRWMKEVDRILIKVCGLGVDDLTDFPSADLFYDGASPQEAAREALLWSDAPQDIIDLLYW